MLKATDLGF